ncbi:NAD(P)-dependent oxidoreductase, partial [Campylobacter coli]|nr:NAD(P)-dependent oxidoreductase [Campylobacter coli]
NFIPFEGGEKLPNWEQKIYFREGILKILDL